ncbi:uncharacterized protein LOC109202921 [Oreochromis niloticus]|uniref:uncharacterized protein LOC109202921 n=1 Tax=Oreochromis niloticus TaxID=8128 RepID=UPI00090574F6|nr:uncharacterized protein LOC109202921 [Oreochromis niloticus]CAI5646499.1 unnamed protein product [Mustela putorius furo]
MKNVKLTDSFTGSRRITQATFDKLLLTFVCEANQPFSIVETSSFKTMMETSVYSNDKENIVLKNTTHCEEHEKHNHQKTEHRELCCYHNRLLAARQHSYLGVTCHWIDDISLERHSAALACRPLKGSHTFDLLAAALEEIHSEYHIREKMSRMTTDSGSNFLKAFRLYGEGKGEETTNWQEDGGAILDDAEEHSELEVEYQDVFAVLDDNTGLEYQLPRHQKCACHLLNLISTVDASAAEANDTYKRLSQSVFAKCHALWNKTSRSIMAYETVERECKLQFLRPNQTRWSSLFLAVERLVRIHKEQGEKANRNVCTALKLKMFNPAEMGFLVELHCCDEARCHGP